MNRATEQPELYSVNYHEASEMALYLVQAENALRLLTDDKVDAIIDATGKPYLLRPAQEHLRQKGRWAEAVLECAADVITVVNRAGDIQWQSPQVNRVLGYEKGALLGASLFHLVLDRDLVEVHSAFFNVIEGIRENAIVKFNIRAGDASYHLVEATMGKMCDGESSNVIFNLRPIQSRKCIEFGQRESDGDLASLPKNRFLAMMAHELRTPLMPVLLCISELQADEQFAEAKPLLDMMRRNIELQTRLLEELADFTIVGQHKLRLRPEPIDAHEAVHYVLEICKAELAAAQMEVSLDLKATNNIVIADSLRLQQVMWNLVRNAIKFSPVGSGISISSTCATEGRITLEFVDHGIGIEPDLLPLVFDPFKQGERVVNQTQHPGLGLGMFIAKGLAEAQEGSLTVSSKGVGLGTTFYLTLKLAPASGTAQANPPIHGPETSGGSQTRI